MGRLTFIILRTVLALVLLGSLFVQFVMVPLLAVDLAELPAAYAYLRTPLIAVAILGVLTMQIAFVCVWKLVTMVRRGTVFSHAAFRYVDVIIAAVASASVLAFILGIILAPGEAVPPGMVLLIGGAAIVIACVALIVLVLRMLLAQAVALDAETHGLKAELDEVI